MSQTSVQGTTGVVSDISFDISGINEVVVSKRALKRMSNLQFLSVHKSRDDGNDRMYIPEEMEFPRRLRLLHWEMYPNKCLPPAFHPEYLVELDMQRSKLEYLWQGTLVGVVASLHVISYVCITRICLSYLFIKNSGNLKGITHLPTSLSDLDLSNSSSERILDCIKALHLLQVLYLYGCRRLASLPELPGSLLFLSAEDCVSLETLYCPLNHTCYANLDFTNCFKLGKQAL